MVVFELVSQARVLDVLEREGFAPSQVVSAHDVLLEPVSLFQIKHLDDRWLMVRAANMALYQVVDLDSLKGDKVIFGSTVEVEDVDSGEARSFTILGPDEADPAKGSISFLSPVGQALLGREVGDEVTVDIPRGRVTYEVINISFKGSNVLN